MQSSTSKQPVLPKKQYVKPSIVLEMKLDTSAGGTPFGDALPPEAFRPPWQIKP